MTMVRNNHGYKLSIGGVTIPAGEARNIRNWTVVQHDPIVKQWIETGIVAVDEGDEKDRLIALLAKEGVTRDRRSSIAKLREELNKARE